MNPRITTEVIEALALLRSVAYSGAIANAVDVLDNAGIFHLIDEATGYDIDPAPKPQTLVRTSKCTCSPTVPQVAAGNHFPNCPGDPAEWGDLAFRYAPAEQSETTPAECTCPVMERKYYGGDKPHHPGCLTRTSPSVSDAAAGGMTRRHAAAMAGQSQTTPAMSVEGRVQCGTCRGDYKTLKDGTLRKHACWAYDHGRGEVIFGERDIYERGSK